MPGLLLDAGTTVLCVHGGRAQATAPVPRVTVMGKPVVTQAAPHVVAGCAGPTPPGPCVMAQWVSAAARVKALGQPVLLEDSHALCVPAGTPVNIVPGQSRVRGT